MRPDEFEYFFELRELELFGDAPVKESVGASKPAENRPTPASIDLVPPPSNWPGDVRPASDLGNERHEHVSDDRVRQGEVGTVASQGINRSDLPTSTARGPAESLGISRENTTTPHTSRVSQPGTVATETSRRTAERSDSNTAARDAFLPGDDLMSVHVLGQFTFCGRAGIYSAEHGDETDLDEPAPRLNYLPNFDLERIEEQLSKVIREFWAMLFLGFVTVVLMVASVKFQNELMFYPAVAGLLLSVYQVIGLTGSLLVLMSRRRAAQRAEAQEPSPTIDQIAPVNWWSMLKAGFDPKPYQRQFRHPDLRLEGSPWRVLEKASLRIPVIKSGADKLGDARYAIFPKHEMRLAAYAMLLEATEHVRVPYGLIFPTDSHIGLAVPITDVLRDQVRERLERSWDLLARSQQRESEPRPPQDRRCATCRLGYPVPISDREVAKAKKAMLPIHVLKDSVDRKYHCACGDRFGSAPPHERIIQLGLSSVIDRQTL